MPYRRFFGPEPNYPHLAALPAAKDRPPHPELFLVAGPCSVEGKEFILDLAKDLKMAGATMLRGGCWRYGTYPPENESGLIQERLHWLADAAAYVGLPFVAECININDLPLFDAAAWIQIGMRHSQHYPLLEAAGKTGKPILLKRGSWMTLDELMGSAEYLLRAGCPEVAVCERGIVTLNQHCRWTLDVSAIAAIKRDVKLRVVGDPSHGSGDRNLVSPLALACVAAGADGVMVEVHPRPDESVSDAEQAIGKREFAALARKLAGISEVVNV